MRNPHDEFLAKHEPEQSLLLLPKSNHRPACRNRGVHVVKMRWGKIVDIDAHEDSQAVSDNLVGQSALGITAASAAPILS